METSSQVLHQIGQYLKLPCTIVLFALMAVALFEIGYVISEGICRMRRKPLHVVALLPRMQGKTPEEIRKLLEESHLLKRQKKALDQLLDTANLQEEVQTAAAQRLLEAEEAYYHRLLAATNLVAKLGPMFGLLGTLIPLGPGIVALGQGDTQTLSTAMNYAFDTTIAGLISAAVCSVISMRRQSWYKRELADLETLMEACLPELKAYSQRKGKAA